MLLESIGLGRSSHRDSRHALSRLSNHQGSTSGCYDIRHEKNGVHWEGCPNFNPIPRQLTPRDQITMSRMWNSGRGIPRLGDPTASMGLPLLQRNNSTPSERYLEGSGGMEALAMGGMGPRTRDIGQNPGGLEALRLGHQDPRVRHSSLDGAIPTGLDRYEELDRRRLQSPLQSDQYTAYEHLMNRNMPARSPNRGYSNPSRQYPLEGTYPSPLLQNPRYHSPHIPMSPTQFQDLGLGSPEYHPSAYYTSNSPRQSHRSTPRMPYPELPMPTPRAHHSNSNPHQSPNPLTYGEIDSPLTSSRYGSIHSPISSTADLHHPMNIEQTMMPYYTTHDSPHGYSGRNNGTRLNNNNNTNYQSPYVEDWVSEVEMGQEEMLQRQAAMEGMERGGFFYDERGGVDDGFGNGNGNRRSRLV